MFIDILLMEFQNVCFFCFHLRVVGMCVCVWNVCIISLLNCTAYEIFNNCILAYFPRLCDVVWPCSNFQFQLL